MNCTMKEAIAIVKQRGQIDVTFTAKHADLEWYGEQNMRATITGIEDYHDETIHIAVSFAKFDEYNKQFESANYYDRNHNPVWTARQAECYNVEDHVFVMDTDKFEDYFVELKRNDLYERYVASGTSDSYVSWLEDQLVMARAFERTVNEALNTGDGTYRP